MGGSGKGDPDMPASIQGEPENRGIITYRDCDHLSDGKSIKEIRVGPPIYADWLQKMANSGTWFLEFAIIEPRLPEFCMK
jgi:hypothetical protein